MDNMNIFDFMYEPYKISKKVRIIELFAGYGSQSLALTELGVPFEHHFVCEFDKYAIQTYNEIHDTNFKTSDITKISAKDLNIVDTDKYDYIMTYSFPCQDLSLAGNRKGMDKGSGTRSGLLWEVERLLKECDELPQILLMENVPQVLSANGWHEWNFFLESLGYKNYCEVLDAKDYGIPQHRERCIMISVLGDYSYSFPKKQELKLRLKDMLEEKVDEKYYLSNKMLNCFLNPSKSGKEFGRDEQFIKGINCDIARTITTKAGGRPSDNFISNNSLKQKLCDKLIENGLVKPYDVIRHSYTNSRLEEKGSKIGRIENHEKISPTLDTRCDCLGVVVPITNELRIRKLTPREAFRLMGVRDKYIDKITCSDAQKYKQAGNSIVVNVLMAIFKQLY